MWQGKNKAVTFSFDDGVVQDRRFVGILNKYGLKGTFNLNSAKLGYHSAGREVNGRTVDYSKVEPYEIRELYRGHEIASHTLGHPDLTELTDYTAISNYGNMTQSKIETLERQLNEAIQGLVSQTGS